MAKAKKTIETVQNQVLSQFERDIRSEAKRTWLNATEMAILKGKQDQEKRKTVVETPRFSHYNPNNPLNGSSSWTREQWATYKAAQKSAQKSK